MFHLKMAVKTVASIVVGQILSHDCSTSHLKMADKTVSRVVIGHILSRDGAEFS